MPVDVRGRRLEIPLPPRRVVSLVPSVTETLFELGAGDAVVGVTDFCIFPEEARTRTRIGGTKNPSVEAISALHPDLVHVNIEENLARHAAAIEEFAPLFASEPRSIADVCALVRDLGEIHRREPEAEQLAVSIESESAFSAAAPFRFACAIWKNPWMWCGGDTYVSNLVTAAGGVNVVGNMNRYPALSFGQIAELKPEVIFLPDEPYAFEETDAEALRTVSQARIVGPFPGHLFTWHGSRTLQGLRFLRRQMTDDR